MCLTGMDHSHTRMDTLECFAAISINSRDLEVGPRQGRALWDDAVRQIVASLGSWQLPTDLTWPCNCTCHALLAIERVHSEGLSLYEYI